MKSFNQYITEIHKPPIFKFLRKNIANSGVLADDRNDRTFVSKLMAGYGFHKLGLGEFADVYGAPGDDFVVKVFGDYDDGYRKWLKFCYDNQSNKYVPKIRGRDTQIPNTQFRAIRLERLEPVRWEAYNKFYEIYRAMRIHYVDTDDADLNKCVRYIAASGLADIHDNNVMQRLNGQLVIVDPMA